MVLILLTHISTWPAATRVFSRRKRDNPRNEVEGIVGFRMTSLKFKLQNYRSSRDLACSQTLYFLFEVHRGRVIKYKPQGFIDRQHKGAVVGEEENRRSVVIFGSNWNLLFAGKATYHWLNGDYPVIIMSTTHHARVMRVEAFVIRELKQQRFWRTSTGSGLFSFFWRWFRANFQSNRLYNSKEAKEYKFYIIKAC